MDNILDKQLELIENGKLIIQMVKNSLDSKIKNRPKGIIYCQNIKKNMFKDFKIIELEKESFINYYKDKGFEVYQEEDMQNNELIFRLVRV